jgi:hypothetical protein
MLRGKEANQMEELVEASEDISTDKQKFEFVTITGQPTSITRNETSKKVRTQAMRDYLRKQNKQAMTGIVEVVRSVNPKEPSRYKGRFKLNTWSHKNQTKVINKVTQDSKVPKAKKKVTNEIAWGNGLDVWRPGKAYHSPNPVFSVNPGTLDPFDTLAIKLGPLSERLLVHCQFLTFFHFLIPHYPELLLVSVSVELMSYLLTLILQNG